MTNDRTAPLGWRRSTMYPMAVLVAVALSLPPRVARADGYFTELHNLQLTHHIQELLFEKWYAKPGGEKAGRKNASERPAAPPLSATDFKPAHKGHPTVDALMATLKDPGQRRQLRTTVSAMMRELAKERANNLATALAMTLGMARAVVDGQVMSDAALGELLASINEALAGSPGYATLTAEQKQMIYEYLAVNAALLALAFKAADRDPEAKAAGTVLAKRFLRQFDRDAVE